MDAGFKIGIDLELLLEPNEEATRTLQTWTISLNLSWPIAVLRAVPHLE
jgi:hypothetical protein